MFTVVPRGLERNDIVFDELEHRYFKDGVEVPSVTQVLQGAGIIPEYKGSADYGYYGDEVHEALAAIDAGYNVELKEDVFRIAMQYVFFREENPFDIVGLEFIVYSDLGYAGRCDRLVDIPGIGLVVLDIKSGLEKPWHILQNAGYAIAINESKIYKVEVGGNVYLNQDSFSFRLYELDKAIKDFKNAFKSYKAKKGSNDGSS